MGARAATYPRYSASFLTTGRRSHCLWRLSWWLLLVDEGQRLLGPGCCIPGDAQQLTPRPRPSDCRRPVRKHRTDDAKSSCYWWRCRSPSAVSHDDRLSGQQPSRVGGGAGHLHRGRWARVGGSRPVREVTIPTGTDCAEVVDPDLLPVTMATTTASTNITRSPSRDAGEMGHRSSRSGRSPLEGDPSTLTTGNLRMVSATGRRRRRRPGSRWAGQRQRPPSWPPPP